MRIWNVIRGQSGGDVVEAVVHQVRPIALIHLAVVTMSAGIRNAPRVTRSACGF